MMFNFCFNRDGKRRLLKKKRHNQSKETPFSLYVSIKIYTHSRSKTINNWLYFCAGILVSYNRLLDITRHSANRILDQYERDRATGNNEIMLDQQLPSNTTMEHLCPSFSFDLQLSQVT